MTADDRGRSEPATMRLFVAALLPDSWMQALATVQAHLRRAGLDLRYVRPEGTHLTLRFLGETRTDRIATVERALAEAAEDMAAFPMRLTGAGTFGPRRRPRVVWVGVGDDSGRLRALHAAVESALDRAGIAPEGRPFHPHLTVARVPDRLTPAAAAAIAPAVAQLSGVDAPPYELDGIALMRSELRPDGARYTLVSLRRFGD